MLNKGVTLWEHRFIPDQLIRPASPSLPLQEKSKFIPYPLTPTSYLIENVDGLVHLDLETTFVIGEWGYGLKSYPGNVRKEALRSAARNLFEINVKALLVPVQAQNPQ